MANTKSRVLTITTELDPAGITNGANLARQEVAKLTQDIGKMMGAIQKSINNALSPLNTAAADLARVSGAYTSAMKNMSTSASATSSTLDGVNRQITSMSTRSKNLVSNMNNAAAAVQQYATASKGINSASISFRNYGNTVADSMKLVNGQFDGATRLVRSLKNDIMDMGRIFAMVTAGFIGAVAVPTKAFGDFQKELLTLKNLASDFTKGELEQFKKTALEVSVANGLMAKDIAASGIELVRLGLNAKETNMVLRQVADAALANSISIVKAAEVGLGATKAMGLGVKDLSMVLDVLTRAAVSSATDISGLSETFKYAAPIFRSADQDIKELGKASIILSNNMIRNSQAGTTLRSMMTSMQAPTVQAKRVMDELGFSLIDSNTGAIKPFTTAVQELREKMAGLDTTTKNWALVTMFGKYALSGASALINSNTKAYEDAAKAIDDTTLSNEKMAAGMRKGVTFEFNRAMAAVNNAAIAMGEKFAPEVEKFLGKITELSQAFTNLPHSVQQNIADMTIWTGKAAVATAGVVALSLSIRTLINFAKELGVILGISGAGGVVAWFHGIVTTLSSAFLSLVSGFTGTTAAAGLLGVGVSATTATVATLSAGLVVAIGYVWALKEGWEALKATLAEEKAWDTAAEGAALLEERLLGAEKAARKLNATQKDKPMTEQELRHAASKRLSTLKSKGVSHADRYNDPQYKAIMQLSRSRGAYDVAQNRALELAGKQAGLDPKSPNAIALKKLEQEQVKIMEEQRQLLQKAGMLTEEKNLIMTAEIEARQNNLKAIQNEAAQKREESAANKIQSENLRKVREDISNVLRQQKEDYEAIRKRVLQDNLNSNADLDINLGAFAEEIAKTKVKVQRVVNECVIATEETLKAMGATNEFLDALTPGVDQTITNLRNLEKRGLGKFSKTPTPGAIALVPQSHAGIVGAKPDTLIHSSSSAGYKFQAAPNYMRSDPSAMYFAPSEKLFKPGALGGVSRDNKALASTIAEKEGAQQSIAKAIKTLEQLRSVYKQGSEEYKAYTDQIDMLRNQSADAANDAIKKQIQVEEEARKKMETIYDENAKAILSAEQDAQRQMAVIRKEELLQKHQEIDQEVELTKFMLQQKYGQYADVSKLIAQEEEKRIAKHLALNLQEQAELTKMVEQGAIERQKWSMNAEEQEMFDIQLKIADLQRKSKNMTGEGAEANKQLLAKLIADETELLALQKQKVQLSYETELAANREIMLDRALAQAQDEVASGILTQFKYDNMARDMAALKVRDAQDLLTKTEKLIDLKPEEKEKMLADARQKLVDATQNLNKLETESYEIQKQKIELDRQRGALSDFEAQTAQLSLLEAQLNKMAPTDLGYNSLLAERNDLLIKNKAATGDVAGTLEALALKLFEVKNLSQAQVTLFDGLTITGEQVKMAVGDLTDSFGKLFSAMSSGGGIVAELMNKLSGVGGALTKIFMGIASTNPVQVIAGVVEALASLVSAISGSEARFTEALQAQVAFNESLADIEARAERTSTRLRLLRGEITELQAQMADQETDRKSKEDQLAAIEKKKLLAQKRMKDQFVQFGPFSGIINRDEYMKAYQELETLTKQGETLKKEIAADALENQKQNNEAMKSLLVENMNNELGIAVETAKGTKATADDVQANFRLNLTNRMIEMAKEVDAARSKGLNIETLQAKHNAELKSMLFNHTEEMSEARKKDAEQQVKDEQETNDKIEQERQEYLKRLYDMDRQSMIDLAKAKASMTYTKEDDIRADAEAERKAAGDRYQGVIEQVKGNSELEMEIKRRALHQYLIEIESADNKERSLIADLSVERQKAARAIALLEAENSRNTTEIMRQELSNRLADLEDWKTKEIELAKGDADRLIEIEREYSAKRVQIQREAKDKIKENAVNQLNDLKSVREMVFQTQSLQYEQAIQQQERFLLDLNKQRDDLQRQIEFYDNQIAKQREQFNIADKGMFQDMLSSVDIPAEIRAGLELIANPQGVPNTRFSRQSQMQAIQERVDMLRQENENLLALEDRSEGDYWKEESRIALIEAATANEMLTNSVTSTKLTAKEKLEIQSKMADAYKRFQEAQLNLIEDQYAQERKLAEAALLENKIQQDQRNAIIAENKFQLDQLTMTYQTDLSLIEQEVLKLNVAHNTMKFGIDEVAASLGNMNPLIDKVRMSYDALKNTMSSVTGLASPIGATGQTGSVSIQRVKNTGQTTPPAGYPVTDGNYWYDSTSNMMKAGALGLKDGGIVGMIPNQDRFKGDKYPLMPGVNGNAGELLVSPIEKLADILPGGNNYNIMVTGNTFKDEVDFKRVMMEFAREKNMRDGMSSGQFMSNLRR